MKILEQCYAPDAKLVQKLRYQNFCLKRFGNMAKLKEWCESLGIETNQMNYNDLCQTIQVYYDF
jgi:hypothetical protein